MGAEVTPFVVAGVAGALAYGIVDWWKAWTGKKPSKATLRVLVLVLVVAVVGGFAYLQLLAGVSIDWEVFGAQIAAGWAVALAAHDVAPAVGKRALRKPPS